MKNQTNESYYFNYGTLIKTVRLTIILFLTFNFSILANSFGQNKISLDLENTNVVQVLDEIEANSDYKFIYKFPRIILSVVVMGVMLYLLLGFFSDKFDYNESWKFIYLFIIVIISLFSYFLISNFSGAFKFKDIKLK